MNIKKTANLLLNFAIKRLAEIFGIVVFLLGLMLLAALISYSPDDPNFIFPNNIKIKNLLGFYGSFTSDLFFQSVGLIAYLISFTYIITGINIFRVKEFFLIIENSFYIILYCIFGTLFFTYFYSDIFTYYINGNGGFVGTYFRETFLASIIMFNENLFYYLMIIIILILFLVSINFNPKTFISNISIIFKFFFRKETKNYTDKNEIINEYIPQDEIKNLIQEDLPFIKNENKLENKIKFKLPNLDFLKFPTQKERSHFDKNQTHEPDLLEKILMDFGVSGSIKKVSHGPVVTLIRVTTGPWLTFLILPLTPKSIKIFSNKSGSCV